MIAVKNLLLERLKIWTGSFLKRFLFTTLFNQIKAKSKKREAGQQRINGREGWNITIITQNRETLFHSGQNDNNAGNYFPVHGKT